MKRIIFVFLFFCLTITTILAQVVITNIAAPNSNGLSNNQVDDFDVTSDGTILNNSASDGTATLGSTAVTGNGNITAGSEANLILFQVTGSTGSDLEGTIEVFGGEAGLIIANPNGIACDGCGFINTNRVDLVTGTANFSGDDLTDFSINGSSTLTVSGDGFVSDAVADELNLTSRYLRINAQAKANNTLRVLSGNETYDHTTNIINSDDTETSGPHSIWIRGALEANYIELINTELDTDGVYGIVNHGGDISADRLRLDSNGLFNNQNDGSINISGLVEVTNAKKFTNNANITADTLTFSIAGDFKYAGSGNIAANNHYFTIRNGNFNNAVSIVTGNFGVTADRIEINSPVTANNFNATAGDSFYHDSGTINAKNFNVTVEKSFVNVAPINADNFNVTVGERFVNYSDVISDIISISAESFINVTTPPLAFAEGTISADTFALSITGNFDYSSDFLNNGNITTNALNLQVGGDFSNNDSASNFTWATNDNLAVLGNADITTDNYIQNGAIDVAGVLTITANNFTYNSPNDDFIWDTNYILVVLGTFDITTNNFVNGGTISADTFAISVAGDFNYSSDFLNNGTNTADNLNFTARNGAFTNDTTIDLAGNLTITANTFTNTGGVVSADTLALSVAGDFDYIAEYLNNGTITTNTYNLQVGGNFSYNDPANDFSWDANDTLTVLGTANIVAADFANSGTITVTNNSLNLTANTFANTGTVDATTVTIEVTNFYDDITNSGTVSSGNLNFILTDDFTHTSDSFNAFNNFSNLAITTEGTFTNNSTIDLAGNLGITANDFINTSGTISADTLTISVAGDFDYSSDFLNNGTNTVDNLNFTARNGAFTNDTTIDLAGNLTITANTFTNTGGVVSADTLALSVAGDFDYIAEYLNNGTITADTLNLNVGGNFSYNDSASNFTWDTQNSLTVLGTANIVAASFNNSGIINVTNSSFDITATDFTNSGTINADTLALSVAGDFDYIAEYLDNGNITTNALNLQVGGNFSYNDSASDLNWGDNDILTVSGNASIDAASFNNSGTITVTNSSFNITATDFTNSGTISANTTLNTTVTSTESGSFANTGGVVSAETFSLSVAGDFDYVVDYLDNGTITTNTLNLTVGGDFSNNSTTDDFVLSKNESISILGDFTIATNNYIQFGTLEVNGALAIEAESNFNNSGSINVTGSGSLAITAGYTAINQGSIVSGSLAITADDFFRNLTGGDIDVASLNITAGGKVTNTANINVGTLTITANNDSTRNDDPAGAFFYVSNRGNITAGSFTIEAVDNFYNRGNITATNFTTSAKSVFFLNKEIDSFYAAGHTYDGGTIILGGTSGLITDGGIIENYGNIDLSGFDLTIVADSFTNHADAIIDANTLNLTVNSFVNGGIIDATIDHQ